MTRVRGVTTAAPAHVKGPRTGPQIVVVMGVSGVGTTWNEVLSTAAAALGVLAIAFAVFAVIFKEEKLLAGIAAVLGWRFAEGDDLHPEANRQKMAAGIPLTDEDRWPWLESIGVWMDGRLAAGESAVVTCSALKRSYRDRLRAGRPVRFCELDAPPDLIADRLEHRSGHFMPTSLLSSQVATFEPLADDEPGVHVSVAAPPDEVVTDAVAALGL